jgi:hypothetical protein
MLIITEEAAVARMKREGVYYKESKSVFEVIQSFFPVLIPFFNILLILIVIFKYEEVYKMAVDKMQERKRILERDKK